jgi:hypothetical protein
MYTSTAACLSCCVLCGQFLLLWICFCKDSLQAHLQAAAASNTPSLCDICYTAAAVLVLLPLQFSGVGNHETVGTALLDSQGNTMSVDHWGKQQRQGVS